MATPWGEGERGTILTMLRITNGNGMVSRHFNFV